MISRRLWPFVRLVLDADRVLVLLQALRARPTIAALEVVPQEVEATRLGGIHDPRLLGMELQAGRSRPRLHLRQRPLGLFSATAQDHEVVGIPHHLIALHPPSDGREGPDRCWTARD